MKVLLRKAQIIDPQSPHNGQVKDILIQKGIITEIADAIPAEADISGLKSAASMNVFQMHRAGLPVQKMSDLTFVFSDD